MVSDVYASECMRLSAAFEKCVTFFCDLVNAKATYTLSVIS